MTRVGIACLLVCVFFAITFGQRISKNYNNAQKQCGECDPEKCETAKNCVAGTTKDRCRCCEVCSKAQNELCDHPAVKSDLYLGTCGDNLECRLRNDLESRDAPEAMCYCIHDGTICGTDDVTYENLCELMESAVIKKKKITVASKGPCKATPVIFGPPEHIKNTTGSNIALICEARGYPIPTVEWTWTRVDGKTFFLPNDDLHVSTQMRGGPEKWQVTGWLQIMDLMKKHEGDYTCIAQNEYGVTQENARVKVVGDGQNYN